MKKRFVLKLILTCIILVIFSFLFPYQREYGYNTHTTDEGPDVSDTSTKWYFTYYSDGNGGLAHTNPNTGANFQQSDWTVNETYGWHEWEYNGNKYVVMAAATCEYLDDLPSEHYPFLSKQSNIHYFHYGSKENNWKYSTFQFKFENNGDTNVYNGIVLDTCEMSIDPSNPAWDTAAGDNYGSKKPNTQWLDVHVELGYPEKSKYNKFNGQQITLTSDGTFSSTSGTTNKSKNKIIFLEILKGFFSVPSDVVNMLMNYTATEGKYGIKIKSEKSDIEQDKNLKKKINIDDAISEDEIDTKKIKNIIKIANIESTIDNKKGEKETVFSENTEIPTIQVDPYSLAMGIFQIFDIDFFNTNSKNTNKIWKGFRNLVASISHTVMYISAVLLLTMLIWRSILFVKSSFDGNPKGAQESKTIIDNVIKAVLIVSCTYAIMLVLLYFYNNILSLILNGNKSIYLIRANVEKICSFNTNYVGYFKYLTMTTNSVAGLLYSLPYFFSTICTLAVFLGMFARTVIIGALVALAPISAVFTMQGKTISEKPKLSNILIFEYFIKFYTILLFAPLIIVILYRMMLNIV